ncbi:hypothetical protein QUF58_09800 [Anaerolineales bacterium HSG24]|nr:hypothetical protein [Anaerolineales bacterium HSG24]
MKTITLHHVQRYLIYLLAFLSIAYLSANIFEHVPHSEDEVAYLFQAKLFAQQRLSANTPPYPNAFWTPFVVDYNGQRFGKYPPGWPILLSIGVYFEAAWLINALLGTATLALIAWLGHYFYATENLDPPEISRRDAETCRKHNMSGGSTNKIGLLAAGLGLVTPCFLFLSSSLLSHTASLFWVTLALLTLCQTYHNAQADVTHWRIILQSMLTGIMLGLVFITRPFAALGVGIPIAMFWLILVGRGELPWLSLMACFVGGLLTSALLPLYWWAITGDPTFNPYLLVWPYDRIGFGADIGPYGFGLAESILSTRLKITALASGLFGWPGWSNLIFMPIPFLARWANRWDWLLLGIIVGLIVVHAFYWAFGGLDGGFPRYYYDALPALLLLTARGILIMWGYLRGQSKWGQVASNGLVALIIGAIVYSVGWRLPPLLAEQKGKYGLSPEQLRPVEMVQLDEPALILVTDVTRWRHFAIPFAANSPTLDGPIVYAIDDNPDTTRQLRQYFKGRACWRLTTKQLQPCGD